MDEATLHKWSLVQLAWPAKPNCAEAFYNRALRAAQEATVEALQDYNGPSDWDISLKSKRSERSVALNRSVYLKGPFVQRSDSSLNN